jgi:hypothetical protein
MSRSVAGDAQLSIHGDCPLSLLIPAPCTVTGSLKCRSGTPASMRARRNRLMEWTTLALLTSPYGGWSWRPQGRTQGPHNENLIGPSGDRAYGGERNTCLVRANSNSCRVIHCACRSVACAYQRAMCAYQVFLCAYQAAISAHGHFICAYADSICAYEGAACAYRASIRAHEPLVCAYEHLVCAYERSVCAHETGQWPLALQNRRSPATLRRSAALPA